MKAIFNSRVIDTSKPLILTSNRAFCYGDGLFETIVTGPDRIDLVRLHLDRLARGCKVLQMDFPKDLTEDSLHQFIDQLKKENKLEGCIRTKLVVWRNEGGLYSPLENSSSFYVECKATDKPIIRHEESIGISSSSHTLLSPISFAKTTNALTYVLAGIEKKEQELDDIILTSSGGFLSETHIGNLFWLKNGQLFTPSLSTGCIEGIMRNYLKNGFQNQGVQVSEVESGPEVLQEAELIFSTNASGVNFFKKLEGLNKEFLPPTDQLTDLIKQLLQL
ncbi:aminotransferase class IV [Roseivirga sp.]|uniref:aminotransferase class IV n=1 Tax=Roseivirga sp. TaxID=1964215 RepID=UPI003B521B62